MRDAYIILVGKPKKRRDHLEDLSIDWVIILKWILNE
jgi:hypothetical protein